MHMLPDFHVLLCYKNFSKDCNVSHIGLGVTAQYTAKTLMDNGIYAQAKPTFGADDLTIYINSQLKTRRPITHVMIMAQWIPTQEIAKLCRKFPSVTFALKCHSNVGFLQAEPPAIHLLREAIDLELGNANFHAASNNHRLAHSLEQMYGHPVTYLPNLYYTTGHEHINKPLWNGGVLKIGAFGSLRVYKNFSTGIAAAIELTSQLKCHSEIWINSGRTDGGGNAVYRTAVEWTKNLPHITLKEFGWSSWPEFRRMIGSMNILMQVSYTETFNNVTADGIVGGVPSVTGPSIEWVPDSWKAEPDDSSEAAGVARRLLTDYHAVPQGYKALQTYVTRGLHHWKSYLEKTLRL